jgi:hypothetical protein
MVSRDLTRVLNERYPKEDATVSYLDQLRTLTEQPGHLTSVPS